MLDNSKDQKTVISHLKAKGIGSNYGAQCIPLQKFFQNKYKLDVKKKFPNALKAFNKGLAIPLYEKLSKDEADYIIKEINMI